MKIDNLKPGQIVWDVQRHKMGNTTINTISVYAVRIQEVDVDGRWVIASWNGNAFKKYWRNSWRRNKPLTIKSAFGAERLATRAEIAAAKAEMAGKGQAHNFLDTAKDLK